MMEKVRVRRDRGAPKCKRKGSKMGVTSGQHDGESEIESERDERQRGSKMKAKGLQNGSDKWST